MDKEPIYSVEGTQIGKPTVGFAANTGANTGFAALLIAVLLGSQAALYLTVDTLFYAVALTVAGLYIARRSSEALWVGFFLLAVTAQLSPVQLDELGTSVQGAYRRYILVVVVVGVSMFVGEWLRPTPAYVRPSSQVSSVWRRIGAFVAVLFLALAYGYFSSFRELGLLDVLRECSGLMTFLVFLFLGYRLSPSAAEAEIASARFRTAVLVYSAFFVIKFIYLSSFSGASEVPVTFGYSQRDAVFFSGLCLILLVAQALTSEAKSFWKRPWFASLVLLLAVLLSGSRSLLACVLLVILSLLFVRVARSNARLRLGLLGIVALVVIVFGRSLFLSSEEGLLGYVSNRFLIVSAEDTSLQSHVSEMLAVAEAIRENPLLGKGPLASYSFFDPLFGWKETTFLDSGLGYLLMKTGLLGTAIFVWFAVGWLKMARALRRTVPALAMTFVFYLVFLPFGPSFFEFQYSWLIGVVVGYTIMLASSCQIVTSAPI